MTPVWHGAVPLGGILVFYPIKSILRKTEDAKVGAVIKKVNCGKK
jgi:hypothetical protein